MDGKKPSKRQPPLQDLALTRIEGFPPFDIIGPPKDLAGKRGSGWDRVPLLAPGNRQGGYLECLEGQEKKKTFRLCVHFDHPFVCKTFQPWKRACHSGYVDGKPWMGLKMSVIQVKCKSDERSSKSCALFVILSRYGLSWRQEHSKRSESKNKKRTSTDTLYIRPRTACAERQPS